MKKEIIATGALCATLLLSVNALASQPARVTLMNTSKPTKVIHLSYRVAHQNRGGKMKLSAAHQVNIVRQSRVSIDLKGYKWAGIVPTRVDGHALPSDANAFGKRHACSIAMDKDHLSGTLGFNLVSKTPKHKGSITCYRAGGTLI